MKSNNCGCAEWPWCEHEAEKPVKMLRPNLNVGGVRISTAEQANPRDYNTLLIHAEYLEKELTTAESRISQLEKERDIAIHALQKSSLGIDRGNLEAIVYRLKAGYDNGGIAREPLAAFLGCLVTRLRAAEDFLKQKGANDAL